MPDAKPIPISTVPAGKPVTSALSTTGTLWLRVAVHDTGDGITVTVDDPVDGKAKVFDYDAMLSARDLVEILRACRIAADYRFGEIEPDQGEDLSGCE